MKKTNQLLAFGTQFSVYRENRNKHTNTVSAGVEGGGAEVLNITVSGTCSKHLTLDD